MKKLSKIYQRVLAVLLTLSFLASSGVTGPMKVRADSWTNFVNKCAKSMVPFMKADTGLSSSNIKATAYLVGTDDVCGKSWLANCEVHDLYAVDPGTTIDGMKVNPKYLPQDNGEYLKTIKEEYLVGNTKITNAIYSKPEGFQGTMREGAYFLVFDYDEEWVTVWDDGFQIWSVDNGILGCGTAVDAYLQTHPAGFYKVKRNEVWIDFALKSNHPYKSETEIPKAGTGVVTKLANLRPVPDETEKVYTPVYALPKGTSVNVVSTELVPSKAEGSTNKYYQVSFNGGPNVQNNAVQYMRYKVPGLYYIDSRYLNFSQKGKNRPAGAIPGVITNVKSGGTVYLYESKDTKSEYVGIVTNGTELWMYPEESDGNWTTVWFSGAKRYVQTKYIKKGKWKVTDISKPYIADIVNDQFVIKWNPGKNNADFQVKIMQKKFRKKTKVVWSNAHYTSNSLTIDRQYMKSGWTLYITVQANDKNDKQGKEQSLSIILPSASKFKLQKKNCEVGKNKIKFRRWISSLQYSTNKKFKNAKIVEKPVKKSGTKNGTTGYKRIEAVKKLKPGKTYYIRIREYKKYRTSAGEKQISGDWSKAVKFKTKK